MTDEEETPHQIPEGAQLVLFYLPDYICEVRKGAETQAFFTLRSAMDYINRQNAQYKAEYDSYISDAVSAAQAQADDEGLTGNDKTNLINSARAEATAYAYASKLPRWQIEMRRRYAMPAGDSVTVPAFTKVLLTKSEHYRETSATQAVITRANSFTSGVMFTVNGELTLGSVALDGNNVQTDSAMLMINNPAAILTATPNATLQNANGGERGGVLYAREGEATFESGCQITGNKAACGGVVYSTKTDSNIPKVTVKADITDVSNAATDGGAVYVTSGYVYLNGNITGMSARNNGGAVFMNGGEVSVGGEISGNSANNGGAFYMEGGNFFYDKKTYLLGAKGETDNQIIWGRFACKIMGLKANAQGEGEDQWELLYLPNGNPAVYTKLENTIWDNNKKVKINNDTSSAFGTLMGKTPLKRADGTDYSSNKYQIQMLKKDYKQNLMINMNQSGIEVTLTTASTTQDQQLDFNFKDGEQNRPATITRNDSGFSMIEISNGKLTLKDITIDGANSVPILTSLASISASLRWPNSARTKGLSCRILSWKRRKYVKGNKNGFTVGV